MSDETPAENGAPAPAPHVKTVLKLAKAMQRNAIVIAVPLAVIGVVLSLVLRGSSGLIGGLIGAVIGLGLGFVGTGVMKGTAQASPTGVMIGAMASFGAKFIVLLVFLIVFRGTTLFDNEAFAFTLLAVTVGWIGGEVVGFIRAKAPSVDV
jgi:ATP synthase protein I